MKERVYETGDGKSTYDELKAVNTVEVMEVIEELDVNQEVSLGTCGTVKRIQ